MWSMLTMIPLLIIRNSLACFSFSCISAKVIRTRFVTPPMDRMTRYLDYVQPDSAELIVDEMLSIRSEIDAWRERKNSR